MHPDAFNLVAADLSQIAGPLDLRLLLVGAFARDIWDADIAVTRFSNDIDFAVFVPNHRLAKLFFEACSASFNGVQGDRLRVIHRATATPVDVVPCGAIERSPGVLEIDDRKFTTWGLVECLEFGLALESVRDVPGLVKGRIFVPPREGFLLLKLLAFADRRERRDLQDLAVALHRFPTDEDDLWTDDAMTAFGAGWLVHEDACTWAAARALRKTFSPESRGAALVALEMIGREPDYERATLALSGSFDERLARADARLGVLRRVLG